MDAGTLELVDLESILDLALECRANHLDPEDLLCTNIVTALTTSCDGPRLSCAAHAAYYWAQIADALCECMSCDKPCSECWTVVAI